MYNQDKKLRPIKGTVFNLYANSDDTKLVMQRSIVIFESVIKSEFTRIQYKYQLEKFLKFSKVKDYDTLVSLDTDTIQAFLESYLLHLKAQKLKPTSIKNYLKGPELFFDMNKKIYFKRVLAKMLPAMEREGNDRPYTTEDIQKMVLGAYSTRLRALIYFFASTGARPSVVEDPILRVRHLYEMPQGCKAVLLYEASREEYWAFLTPEAVKALDEYLNERRMNGEPITQETPLFVNSKTNYGTKTVHMTSIKVRQVMFRLVRRTRIQRIKSGTRFDKAVIYGFRKRFNTILKLNNNINSNIAEKLMGHKNGLDAVYLKPTREQCFAEFVKAVPDLAIFPEPKKEEVQVEVPIPKPKEYPIYG